MAALWVNPKPPKQFSQPARGRETKRVASRGTGQLQQLTDEIGMNKDPVGKPSWEQMLWCHQVDALGRVATLHLFRLSCDFKLLAGNAPRHTCIALKWYVENLA